MSNLTKTVLLAASVTLLSASSSSAMVSLDYGSINHSYQLTGNRWDDGLYITDAYYDRGYRVKFTAFRSNGSGIFGIPESISLLPSAVASGGCVVTSAIGNQVECSTATVANVSLNGRGGDDLLGVIDADDAVLSSIELHCGAGSNDQYFDHQTTSTVPVSVFSNCETEIP